MTKFAVAAATAALLTATTPALPVAAAEPDTHTITREAAWGCRDRGDVINLLFLGLSTTFDATLASALADGRCVSFTTGESVAIVDRGSNGLVRIARPGEPTASYWTPARNLK